MTNANTGLEPVLQDGWRMPDAPICPLCGNKALPIADFLGPDWHLFWHCDDCMETVAGDLDWPFRVEPPWFHDNVSPERMQALGFVIN